jgi:hypothetical protein
MTQRGTDRGTWPDLPYLAWRETCTTLHLWTQIVGKIRLSQTPWLARHALRDRARVDHLTHTVWRTDVPNRLRFH